MANTYNICTKLQSIADALGDAQTSELIDALADIAQAISHGGGGTSDYTQLTNKPQINSNVLSGNQTSAQLGLQSTLIFDNTPTSGSTNPVTSDGIYDAIDTINSNKADIPLGVDLLGQNNGNGWNSAVLSHNIDEYNFLIICVSPAAGSIDWFPFLIPTSFFKLKNSVSNYLGGYYYYNNAVQGFGVYYIDNTHAAFNSSNTAYYTRLYGVK